MPVEYIPYVQTALLAGIFLRLGSLRNRVDTVENDLTDLEEEIEGLDNA